jgi:hypothetical protein
MFTWRQKLANCNFDRLMEKPHARIGDVATNVQTDALKIFPALVCMCRFASRFIPLRHFWL